DHTAAQRLAGVDDVGSEDELLRAREADQLREQIGSTAVGYQADLAEELAELRRLGRHHEIAGKGEVTAGAYRIALDHGQRRTRKIHQPDDEAVQQFDPGATLVCAEPAPAHGVD